jgi:hypothetical protein
MRMSRTGKIGATIAAIAFVLAVAGIAIAAKMDCKQACDLMKKTCVDSCTGALKKKGDGQQVNQRAVAKCKEACENARKKCEEMCKAQKDQGGDDDEGADDE